MFQNKREIYVDDKTWRSRILDFAVTSSCSR